MISDRILRSARVSKDEALPNWKMRQSDPLSVN